MGSDGPRVEVICGPRGSGRSTTLDMVTDRLKSSGVSVLRARCHPDESSNDYGVVRQLLDDVELHPGRYVPGASDELFYQTSCKGTEVGPMAMVIDDLGLADRPSLLALSYLSRRLDRLALTLVVTVDPERPDLPLLIAQLQGLNFATTRALPPLDPSEERTLIEELIQQPLDEWSWELCHRTAAGSPKVITALGQCLSIRLAGRQSDRHEDVRAACSAAAWQTWYRWLDQSDPQVTQIYRALLVLGPGTDLSTAALLCGFGDAEAHHAGQILQECRMLRRTSVGGVQTLFDHYDYLSMDAVAQLHAQAARSCTRLGASARTISHHLMASGTEVDAESVSMLRRSAAESVQTGDWFFAGRALSYALLRAPESVGLGEVAIDLHDVQLRSDIEACLQSTIGLEDTDLPRQQVATRLAPIANILLPISYSPISALMRDLADELQSGCGEPSQRALSDLSAQQLIMGNPRVALRAIREAGPHAQTHHTVGLLAARSVHLAARGRHRQGCLSLIHKIAPDAVSMSQLDPVVIALAALAATWADDLSMAQLWCLAGASAARAKYRRADEGLNLLVQAEVHDRLGHHELAKHDAETAAAIFQEVSAHSLRDGARALATRSALRLGQVHDAEVMLNAVKPQSGVHPVLNAMICAARGQLAQSKGNDSGAMSHLFDCARYLESAGINNPGVVSWRPDAVRILQRTKNFSAARALAEREVETARNWGGPIGIGRALRLKAGLLSTNTERIRLLRESVTHLEAACSTAELRSALTALAAELAMAGETCGATDAMARADQLGRFLDTSMRTRDHIADTDADRLTTAEWRVVNLVVKGHSNTSAARQLFLSKRTIDTHLGRVYRKLGINSRGQLAGAIGPDRMTAEQVGA